MLKEGKRRNAKLSKAYIAVFVCFTVKAIHLELVSDLTSDAFLGAFKRFISRRGRPECVYSDNGTTFVGANKQIKEMYEFVRSDKTQADVKHFLSNKEIKWNFIPPHAPHFGGLWEAGVKSTKTHLSRVIGHANLTFEELQTTLCEIEAVLNSRPLVPLSADQNDYSCITPGHFLIGAALCSYPVADLTHIPEGRLIQWQRVEQIRQHFWARWSSEYLHTLVQRTKWHDNKGEEIRIGQLVLIQQPKLAPLQWLLGRIKEVHPGADGIVRAATVATKGGEIKRPTAKLAVLPL
ncbi:uncharacterized protein [Cardiocondyla obscurior]|uniref:uncharacterized protein n=1 Tax=Cardiocondyla obscurior TaxID=286306 RepID=UPI0039658AD9